MARVLCTLDEPCWQADGRMAGLQVRVHELAGALRRAGHEVLVAAEPTPAVAALRPDYEIVPLASLPSLPPVDVWVTHPRLVARWADTLAGAALVVDGYESPFGSFLAHAAALLPRHGVRVAHAYRRTVADMLSAIVRADRVLCATESQRISYLTLLAALGRIGPADPSPEMVLTVCSGAAPAPPAPLVPARPAVLWAGGCYPWFDVDTLLRTLPAVVERVPDAELLFVGLGGVDGADVAASPLPNARRVHDAVQAAPALRARARFLPWCAYPARAGLYQEAAVAVCTYGAHLETTLAMRTRVIDLAWGGVPQVVSAGDPLSALLTESGAARAVPAGDVPALAGALVEILTDPARRAAMAAAAHALACGPLAWDRQVRPLAEYCTASARGARRRRPLAMPAAPVRVNDGWGRALVEAVQGMAARVGRLGARVVRRGRALARREAAA